MIQIFYGKDQYHLQDDMQKWAQEHFGPGCLYSYNNIKWLSSSEEVWGMETRFGMTWFNFKYEPDAMFFMLKWPTCR